MSPIPPIAPNRTLSPPALALRDLLVAAADRLWSADWKPELTVLAWRLATEPPGSVDLGPGVDDAAVASTRQILSWWSANGEMWLVEDADGLRELPIPHWVALQTPIDEPVSALADPNVQLAVSMSATRCARCGADIEVGDPFGMVHLPSGPGGWCCQDCVVGESASGA